MLRITNGLKVFCLSLALVPVVLAASGAGAETLKDAFQSRLSVFGGEEGVGYNEQRNVEPIIGNAISVVLSFLGVIFLGLTFYGGFMWMTAAGDEKKAKTARELITAATAGLIVVVASYAATLLVMSRFASDLINQ